MPGADDWIMGATAAQDAYRPVDAPWLPDVGGPAIGGGGQFSAGVPAVNRMADSISKALFVRPPEDNSPSPVIHQLSDPRFALTERDLDTATSLAMGFSGGGLTTKPIKAYHSSPHDFDKFDLKKIGTGEGAQVYGHGLYFAENPAVSGQGGQYWNQFTSKFEGPEYLAAGKLKQAGFDRDAAAALAQKDVDALTEALKTGAHPAGLQGGPFDEHTLRSITRNMMADRQAELDLLRSNRPVGPRTYEVNIKADPAQMLDWDKPLRDQQQVLDALSGSRRKSVKEVLNRQDYFAPTRETYGRDIGPVTGQDFYKALSYNMTGKPGAAQSSQAMQAGGIPGIKYLDEGSRASKGWHLTPPDQTVAGKWMVKSNDYNSKGLHFDTEVEARAALAKKLNDVTHNYVMFDPSIIDIMKKYGIAGAAPAGMGALAAQDYYRSDR